MASYDVSPCGPVGSRLTPPKSQSLSIVMRNFRRIVLALLLLGGASSAFADFKVLVFSKTGGFRHSSIPDGIALVQSLGSTNNFQVDTTENAAAFNTTNLAQYAVVIFMMTSGDILDAAQKTAFENYIQSGGAWVGVHSA